MKPLIAIQAISYPIYADVRGYRDREMYIKRDMAAKMGLRMLEEGVIQFKETDKLKGFEPALEIVGTVYVCNEAQTKDYHSMKESLIEIHRITSDPAIRLIAGTALANMGIAEINGEYIEMK